MVLDKNIFKIKIKEDEFRAVGEDHFETWRK